MRKKEKLKIYNPHRDQQELSPLAYIFKALMSIIKVIIISIVQIVKILLQMILFLLLTIAEFFVKICPKRNKSPFKRSFSNQNFTRLKNYDVLQTVKRRKKLILVFEVDKLVLTYKKIKDKQVQLFEDQYLIHSEKDTYLVTFKPNFAQFFQNLEDSFSLIVFTTLPNPLFIQLLPLLDPKSKISTYYCQDKCIKHPKGLIKDINLGSQDLSRTIIVDHNQHTVSLNKDNTLIFDIDLGLDFYYKDLMDIQEAEFYDVRELLEDIRLENE